MQLLGIPIVAVASDFDGTILKDNTQLPPPRFFEAVHELFKQNIPFIAASGRQYANLRHLLSPIADQISYIAENGCLVVHQGKVVHKRTIDRSLAMELIRDMLSQPGGELLISGENTGYTVTSNQEFITLLLEKIHYRMTLLTDYEQIPEDILKMSIYWKEGIPPLPEKWFHEKYDSLLQVADGGNGWLDFNPLGSGKGQALEVLAEHMQIPISQIAAFGDNENDLSMLQKAGIGYAVSSARPHIKAMADAVCDSVEETLLEALRQNA